jgi:hypothetical protein
VLHQTLDICDGAASIALIPTSVEVLGDFSELYNEIAGEVLRANFTPFLAPEPDEGRLIVTHDDSGVGTPNESPLIV